MLSISCKKRVREYNLIHIIDAQTNLFAFFQTIHTYFNPQDFHLRGEFWDRTLQKILKPSEGKITSPTPSHPLFASVNYLNPIKLAQFSIQPTVPRIIAKRISEWSYP
ncbi:hypothetical protein CEXT_321351 [Caerostris extrusa]|uniref:Uncharacterized protein n=1 Tax=Caerostris extrusa TaxID=172846 RepID=A0AAV4UB59_CAEEX|nr:hypothetical protein CEXT_321351 [Caerostris extrusa]